MINNTADKMIEHRDNERHSIFAEVEMQEILTGEVSNTKSINISNGGISLYSDKRLPPGEIVRIRLIFPFTGNEDKLEQVLCKVKWIVDVGNSCVVGLQFDVPINKESHPAMAQCLDSALFMEDVFYI